jgi:hypothetical protein
MAKIYDFYCSLVALVARFYLAILFAGSACFKMEAEPPQVCPLVEPGNESVRVFKVI